MSWEIKRDKDKKWRDCYLLLSTYSINLKLSKTLGSEWENQIFKNSEMNLVCCWCEHKMVSLYGKQHGNNLKKKNRWTIHSSISISQYSPKRIKSRNTDICTSLFIAALFARAKRQKQHNFPLMEKLIKCDICIKLHIIQP